jgi:hypothetical protein
MKFTRNVRRLAAAVAVTGLAVGAPAVSLAASGSSSAAPATFVRCVSGQLTDWIGTPGSGAAGSTYYQLEITNISAHGCSLYGFPGVSATRDGAQVGSAAGRDHSHAASAVFLSPGATTHVILRLTDVGNFGCKAVTATGLRVYAPGAYTSKVVPFSFAACGRKGPVFLHVTVDLPGTGIPGYSI